MNNITEVIIKVKVQSYSELIVWQKAMNLVEDIYRLTKKFPREEIYSLTDQIRRAAVSIPSCIAEGHDRFHSGQYSYFLSMAQGSRAELETQIILADRLGYIENIEKDVILDKCQEISKMLYGLISKIK